MNILIVEDDTFFGQRLKELLLDHGLEGFLVNTVQDAIKFNFSEVIAVISDVMLPNDPDKSGISAEETRCGFSSGIALVRRIREKHPELPVLLFSAIDDANDWASKNNIPFVLKEEGPKGIIQGLRKIGILDSVKPRAFIVHGHDEVSLLELKNYIQNTLDWQEPIVLREKPNSGKTIIEKFEEHASCIDYVFVLMTPDDIVVDRATTNDEKRRSRQNVVFELGFFYGQLGRNSGRIIVLHKGPIELPSDIQGIVWIDISNGINAAGEDIRKEINLS